MGPATRYGKNKNCDLVLHLDKTKLRIACDSTNRNITVKHPIKIKCLNPDECTNQVEAPLVIKTFKLFHILLKYLKFPSVRTFNYNSRFTDFILIKQKNCTLYPPSPAYVQVLPTCELAGCIGSMLDPSPGAIVCENVESDDQAGSSLAQIIYFTLDDPPVLCS